MANVSVKAPTSNPAAQTEALVGSLPDAGMRSLDHCMSSEKHYHTHNPLPLLTPPVDVLTISCSLETPASFPNGDMACDRLFCP